jgi:hypothetical protein
MDATSDASRVTEYVGLDLHKRESQLCILTAEGPPLERRGSPSSAAAGSRWSPSRAGSPASSTRSGAMRPTSASAAGSQGAA